MLAYKSRLYQRKEPHSSGICYSVALHAAGDVPWYVAGRACLSDGRGWHSFVRCSQQSIWGDGRCPARVARLDPVFLR